MNGEREVGGLWCREVLERLSDYVDDALSAADKRQVDDHLRECDVCSQFGHEVAAVVTAIRRRLSQADPLPADLLKRVATPPEDG